MDIVGRYLMGIETVREITAGVARNTDDNMRVEHTSPVFLRRRSATGVVN